MNSFSPYCACGKKIDTTGLYVAQYQITDDKGNVLYAICQHGTLIIDKLSERSA